MPPVRGAEGAFYATPDSEEIADLDRRWAAGEFLARVDGKLIFDEGDQPAALFVPDGHDPRLVGGLLAATHEPPAISYFGNEVTWRE